MEKQNRPNRKDIEVPVEFRHVSGDRIRAVAKNVSPGGLFISTTTPLEEGSKTFVQILVSDGALRFHVEAEVVWSQRKRPGRKVRPHGMGIRFLDSGLQSKKIIDGVVSVLNGA